MYITDLIYTYINDFVHLYLELYSFPDISVPLAFQNQGLFFKNHSPESISKVSMLLLCFIQLVETTTFCKKNNFFYPYNT